MPLEQVAHRLQSVAEVMDLHDDLPDARPLFGPNALQDLVLALLHVDLDEIDSGELLGVDELPERAHGADMIARVRED